MLALGLLAGARPAQAQLANAITGTPGKDEAPRLGGFDLDFTVSDSSGLNAVGQNYRNELSLYFEPRWSVGKVWLPNAGVWSKLAVSGRFVLTGALAGTGTEYFGSEIRSEPQGTCSNIVPSPDGGVVDPRQVGYCNPRAAGRRLDYSDVWLTAGVPRLVTIPRVKLDVPASLRVILPLSAQSRFQTLRFGLTATSGLARAFLADKLRISFTGGFTKNFHAYSTPGLEPAGITAGETGGNASSPLEGVGISNLYADPARVGTSGYNTSFSLSNALSARYEFNGRWNADVLYMWVDGFTYGHRCLVAVVDGAVDSCRTGAEVAAASGSEVTGRGHKRSQVFWVTVAYQVRPWLGLSLAWVNWAPRMMPDSSYRQGFISTDYNAFTSVMLSASTSLDQITARWRAGSQPAR
jgi:hypothetical protein